MIMNNLSDEEKRKLERRLHNAWDEQRRKKKAHKGIWTQILLSLAAIILIVAMIYILVTI